MGENDWIKKEMEADLLDAFVESHELITGRRLTDIETGESPDFTAHLDGQRVGLEVTEVRVDGECDPYDFMAEAWRIADKKNSSYLRHNRFQIPIILIFFSRRPPLADFHGRLDDVAIDDFSALNFHEVWLADMSDEYFSNRDPRRPADLFGLAPVEFRGFHRFGDWDRKPYG